MDHKQVEIDALRKRVAELEEDVCSLQQEIDLLTLENQDLVDQNVALVEVVNTYEHEDED